MVDETRLAELSAALDGEAPMPTDLSDDEEHFVDASLRLRAALRVTAAEAPPDVTAAVLDRLPTGTPPTSRRPLLLVAAAVFVVAAIAGALAVRPGGPAAPRPAAAGLAERVIDGQRAIGRLDATMEIVERGAHPDVPVRTLTGTLRYEAPERFQLRLREQGPVPDGWPRHDSELLLDAGSSVLEGLTGCPLVAQPGCLRHERRVVTDLAPFSPTWISPLDLVVPADAFLPAVDTPARERGGVVVVETTVARIERLVSGLTTAASIRAVHATDAAELELDAETLVLRRLTVTAADNLARTTWAATNGYHDRAGATVLSLTLRPAEAAREPWPSLEADGEGRAGGFTDVPLDPPWPAPEGFRLGRTGILEDGGPRTRVYAYSDGRAWLRIDVTEDWDEERLFGALGAVVTPVDVGAGVGYTEPGGTRLALHTADRDVLVTGSVGLDVLRDAAADVLVGEAIPSGWPQGQRPAEIPDGALVPSGDHVAVIDGNRLVIGVGGPGSTGLVLHQAPAATLAPPIKGDVVEATVRGVSGRYYPRLGVLAWLEGGWQRELVAPGLDLAELRAVAASLVAP